VASRRHQPPIPNPQSPDRRGSARLTVAAFIERALYDSANGYYARAAQRSGRAGDFFTSVDVGPLFGELLELQIEEMWRALEPPITSQSPIPNPQSPCSFDLVEAGAGNGRLSADILRAARASHPALFQSIRLHLVEASAAARAAQRETLGDLSNRLAGSSAVLPESFEGVLIANELLDAMPVHQLTMTEEGLREVYVQTTDDGRLTTAVGPVSTPRLAEYLEQLGVALEPGWTIEINLNAVDWIRNAACRLRRGFIILIDYGHEARELYSVTHAAGTLTTFSGHRSQGAEASAPSWLQNAGEQDITSHVDFTSVRRAAEAEGMTALGFLDQTYFVLGLCSNWEPNRLAEHAAALKTLMLPGGLGSTMKVLLLGKGVGRPQLRGCSFSTRAT
jgi:SAM-dependent MidA family methyltransferase